MIEAQTDANPFPHTKWTMVIELRDKNSEVREKALEELCGQYWAPIYAYARRLGHSPADAEDLTQGFYKMMLRRRDFGRADRNRGKFRTFVRSAFRNFVKDQYKFAGAQKRGGEAKIFSIDQNVGENRLQEYGDDHLTPEQEFDRQFAVSLLDRAITRMRKGFENSHKAERFDLLRPYLDGNSAPSYAVLASSLNQSESAVKSTVHRFRGQFKAVMLAEVEETLGRNADSEGELRYLLGLFS